MLIIMALLIDIKCLPCQIKPVILLTVRMKSDNNPVAKGIGLQVVGSSILLD